MKAHQRQASNPFEALTCFPLLKAHQYARVSGFNFRKELRTSRRKSFVLYHFYNTEVQDVYLSYFTGVRWLPKLVNQRLMFRWRVFEQTRPFSMLNGDEYLDLITLALNDVMTCSIISCSLLANYSPLFVTLDSAYP